MSEISRRRPYAIYLEAEDKQGDSSNKSRKRLKLSPEELCENPEIVLKSRNLLKFFYSRELGSTAGEQAKKEFYRIKTSYKEKVWHSSLSLPFRNDSCEVNFIKGDDKSLFVVWCGRVHKEKIYYQGEISYNMNKEDDVQLFIPCMETIDACQGRGGLVTLFNHPPRFSPTFFQLPNLRVPVTKESFPPPWHCCCFVPGIDALVLGGDGYLVFIFYHRNIHRLEFPGAKVCTVSFYEPSRKLVIGLDTGFLNILDSRGASYYVSIKILDEAVNDCVFVNDHEVIAADVKGKLIKVELRTKKASAEFFGHKHSVNKRPFSVANDMLCATGADNVVRIWHLSGGHPVHVLRPTSTHEARGWLRSDGIKTYLHYFERNTRTVFKI